MIYVSRGAQQATSHVSSPDAMCHRVICVLTERKTPFSSFHSLSFSRGSTGPTHAHNPQHAPSTTQQYNLLTQIPRYDTFSISQWRPLLLPSSPTAPYWPSWSHLRLSDTSPYSLTKKNPLEVTCAVVSVGRNPNLTIEAYTTVAATRAKERELQRGPQVRTTTRGDERMVRQMIILANASVLYEAVIRLGGFQANLTLTSGRHLATKAVRSTKKRVFESCERF